MTACPSCAAECPAGARFCPSCGAALATPPPHAVERKVVTTMFCDLVDFTGLCEQADSEDVDRLLRTFYAVARNAIEIYGGVVEKFVGDAVVGVFGVPAAHEDDAERAVHTALRLRERLAELPQIAGRTQQVRVGINTGVAVVRLDVLPGSGEGFLVGDAVNTAARLEQLAPPMGLVVGERTHRLTERRIVYEALKPATLKGKRAAAKCWLVRGPVSRMGADPRQRFPAALVDREVELGVLRGLLKKVRTSSRPQFVLVTGEAGIGKSRLVFELLRYIDSRPAIVRWRQGRCPAYGDGLTFWALSEIFKEQLGVVERDEVATVEAKLAHALEGTDEQEWLAARLRPLLGLEGAAASREENFAAWRRFLEIIAGDCPAVIVFEDLHWASEATLAFLRHLVENLGEVPLLLIGTARPELLRAQPEMAAHLAELGSSQRVVRLDLEPLSETESEELVVRVGHGLTELPEASRAIAERSAGNPLFAEQLVGLLQEAQKEEESSPATDVALKDKAARALPESLQSLIGARLDGLPPERKALVGDAAVVGEVFWTGAVAALDHGDRTAAEEGLRDLAQRDLLRHNRDSSLAGENEFAFRHALIRDVAYEQLTHADRAAKHAAVARWLEATAGERIEEIAEIVAHHYQRALELAEATGNDALAAELHGPTARALELAGRVAMGLDMTVALEHYARAVDLGVPGTPEHLALTHALAEALLRAGRLQEAAATFDEVADGQRSLGASEAADLAAAYSWYVRSHFAGSQVAFPLRPSALLDSRPTRELIPVLTMAAGQATFACRSRLAMELADRAIRISRELGLPEPHKALEDRVIAACQLGSRNGAAEYKRVLSRAESTATGHELCVFISNYGETLLAYQGTRAAVREQERALSLAERLHDTLEVAHCRSLRLCAQYWAGHWGDVLAEIEETSCFLEEHNDIWDLVSLRAHVALMHLYRGDVRLAERSGIWAETNSRGTPIVPARASSLIALATVHARAGRHERALEYLGECLDLLEPTEGLGNETVLMLPQALWTASGVGGIELAGRLANHIRGSRPFDRGTRALVAGLRHASRGDMDVAAEAFAAAAGTWAKLRYPFQAARALHCQGVCLVRLGRQSEGAGPLAEAQRIFARLGARPATDADAFSA